MKEDDEALPGFAVLFMRSNKDFPIRENAILKGKDFRSTGKRRASRTGQLPVKGPCK